MTSLVHLLTLIYTWLVGLFVKDRSSYNAQYQDMLRVILSTGKTMPDRTGVGRITVPGYTLKADLRKEFPALNLRKAPIKAPVDEMRGFLQAVTNALDFDKLGCKFWYQNANENKAWLGNPFREGENDCGPIYGAGWTKWPAYTKVSYRADNDKYDEQVAKLVSEGWVSLGEVTDVDAHDGQFHNCELFYKEINQFKDCIKLIINNPDSRRVLFHGWNPATLNQVSLPACHLLYQFICLEDELHLITYQR